MLRKVETWGVPVQRGLSLALLLCGDQRGGDSQNGSDEAAGELEEQS